MRYPPAAIPLTLFISYLFSSCLSSFFLLWRRPSALRFEEPGKGHAVRRLKTNVSPNLWSSGMRYPQTPSRVSSWTSSARPLGGETSWDSGKRLVRTRKDSSCPVRGPILECYGCFWAEKACQIRDPPQCSLCSFLVLIDKPLGDRWRTQQELDISDAPLDNEATIAEVPYLTVAQIRAQHGCKT